MKNVVKAPNTFIGDYTYYDDRQGPAAFEQNNVLFNYPEFGDRLIIGKFCAIAGGNPAAVRRQRFDKALSALLLELNWWDLPPEALTQALPMLCNPDLKAFARWARDLLNRRNAQPDSNR
ncbi:MAG: hypothetical protein MR004_03940 [Clostridiales bacterium]|nr:hypothetical protein [bacterium 210917-SL.2.15]MCI5842799.1 hypothetical protein [Clostridiales bacterium]